MADRPQTNPEPWKGLNLRFGRQGNVRRPGSVTALDADGEMLRVAQCAPRGNGTAVTRVALMQLGLAPDADRTDPVAIGGAIAAALEKLELKPVQAVMGVPRQLVVLRTLTLPLIEDVRELASMVHLQIAKDLPFRQEEAIIDFKVRGQTSLPPRTESEGDPDKKPAEAPANIDVLVAAIRRDTVEFYQKVAAAAKLKLIALGWLSQANARCVEACETAAVGEVVALISLRPDDVGVDVLAQGALLFSRGARVTLQTDSPPVIEAPAESPEAVAEPAPTPAPATYVEAVTIEVVRSLHSYGGMESREPVVKLVVSGATGQEQTVLESLRARLQMPCSLLNPADALDLPKSDREHAADAVGAIGLGLGVNDPEGLPFDFLNPKRPAVQRNMQRIRALAVCAAVAALFIALLGARSHLINQRMKINRAVGAELKQAETQRSTYRKTQLQAAAVQNWTKDARNWLEHFAYLSAVLPGSEDIYITSLTVSAQGNIHLAVQARSGEILASLDRQLRAAGYEVKPLAITPGNEKFGYNFRSTVELILPAKMKIDLTKAQPPARPADDGSLDPKSRPVRKGGRS